VRARERRDRVLHPAYTQPELLATGPQPALELGYHKTARPGEVDLLLCLVGEICGSLIRSNERREFGSRSP
jgi:hypothetical protein